MNPTNLARAVQDALMQYTPLRIWKHSLKVIVEDGSVVLTGTLRNHSAKTTAERIARSVKGVTVVKNQIVVDDDVEVAVAQALAADPRTLAGFPGIVVGVVFGVTYLKGTVASAAIKDAATEVAIKLAGIKHISNELVVAGAIPAA